MYSYLYGLIDSKKKTEEEADDDQRTSDSTGLLCAHCFSLKYKR